MNSKLANFKKIIAFFSSEQPKAIELAEEKLENGTVLISDEFKEGMPIFIKSEDEDGENVKLPIGEYQMEGGKILNVEVEGEIASIGEAKIEAEEPSEEQEELEVVEDETEIKEEQEEVEVEEETVGDHMKEMHDMIASLEARIAALEPKQDETSEEELVAEEKIEMSAEEVVAEEPVMEPAIEVVAEETQTEVEVAPIAHSPEASDERRVRFYFPKN